MAAPAVSGMHIHCPALAGAAFIAANAAAMETIPVILALVMRASSKLVAACSPEPGTHRYGRHRSYAAMAAAISLRPPMSSLR
jgi:hypothetical protein